MAAAANDDENAYFILGHGTEDIEKGREFILPEGKTLVILASCGRPTIAQLDVAQLRHLFTTSENKELLMNPIDNYYKLRSFISKDLTIYEAGEKIPNISVKFISNWGSDFSKAGVFPYPMTRLTDNKGDIIRLNPKTRSTFDKKDIMGLYEGSIFPKNIEGLIDISSTEEGVYIKQLEKNMEFPLSAILKNSHPGVYYYAACRSLPIAPLNRTFYASNNGEMPLLNQVSNKQEWSKPFLEASKAVHHTPAELNIYNPETYKQIGILQTWLDTYYNGKPRNWVSGNVINYVRNINKAKPTVELRRQESMKRLSELLGKHGIEKPADFKDPSASTYGYKFEPPMKHPVEKKVPIVSEPSPKNNSVSSVEKKVPIVSEPSPKNNSVSSVLELLKRAKAISNSMPAKDQKGGKTRKLKKKQNNKSRKFDSRF